MVGAAALAAAALVSGKVVSGGRRADEANPTVPVIVPSLGRAHRVVVVGAGFAGIGAALELQRLGMEVVVLEVGRERSGGNRERGGAKGGLAGE